MKKYKVQNLSESTSSAEQGKLINALRDVRGVSRAVLHLQSSELEIGSQKDREAKRADIAAAASQAGFSLTTES